MAGELTTRGLSRGLGIVQGQGGVLPDPGYDFITFLKPDGSRDTVSFLNADGSRTILELKAS